MESPSKGVLDENKEHHLGSEDKPEKWYDESRHIQFHMSKYKKNEDMISIMSNLEPNCCLKHDFHKVDQPVMF